MYFWYIILFQISFRISAEHYSLSEELHAPPMGPESHSCTLPLGRPVSRKAVKYYLKLCRVVIVAGAFLTDVDRFPWKSQSEFCVVRATHKFKSLGFVCSPSFFSLPTGCRLFSHGVIFTLVLLSLRKNGGPLVV